LVISDSSSLSFIFVVNRVLFFFFALPNPAL
jgi:hypothetical protein